MNFASIESHRSFLQYLISDPGVRVWSQVRSVSDGDLDIAVLSDLAAESGYTLSVTNNLLTCEVTQ